MRCQSHSHITGMLQAMGKTQMNAAPSNALRGTLFLVTGPDAAHSYILKLLQASQAFLGEVPALHIVDEGKRLVKLPHAAITRRLCTAANVVAHVAMNTATQCECDFFFYPTKIVYVDPPCSPLTPASALGAVAAQHNLVSVASSDVTEAGSKMFAFVAEHGSLPPCHSDIARRWCEHREDEVGSSSDDEGRENASAAAARLARNWWAPQRFVYKSPIRSAAHEAANTGADFPFEATADECTGEDAAKGEESSWCSAVVEPHGASTVETQLSAPSSGLELEWVHGYRAQDVRGSVRYAAGGVVVYSVGAVGIVYDPKLHTQRHHLEHTDDIISLAVSPDGTKVATGQVGTRPCVHVWDVGSCSTVATLSGFHRRGVSCLAFSPDGTLLASVGQDDNHSLMVGRWADGGTMGTGICGRQEVLDVKFVPWSNGEELVTCGVDHVKFIKIKSRCARTKMPVWGSARSRMQTGMCIGFVQKFTVIGMVSGELYVWLGRRCIEVLPAHEGAVTAIHNCSQGLVTGGTDGEVVLWDSNLNRMGAFICKSATSSVAAVSSVCWNDSGSYVLFGNNDGSICQGKRADLCKGDVGDAHELRPIVQCHADSSLHGLAMHPKGTTIITSDSGGKILTWDTKSHKLLNHTTLKHAVRTVAFAPDGTKVVAGCDDGTVIVLDTQHYRSLQQMSHTAATITVAKFSSDGSRLTVGTVDGSLYIMNTVVSATTEGDTGADDGDDDGQEAETGFALIATCAGHEGSVSNIDFSTDGTVLQSNSTAGELMYWDVENGARITDMARIKTKEWASWTCIYGWPVQGLWDRRDGMDDGTSAITLAVCRSHGSDMIVSGDSFGHLKLRRYPCTSTSAQWRRYYAHSPQVRNVCFAPNDETLFSLGGEDRALMQWRVRRSTDRLEKITEDIASQADPVPTARSAERHAPSPRLPWLQRSKVISTLGVEWVHGYRAQDVRGSVRYAAGGVVVYSVGAVGIVYDPKLHTQRHHLEHTDDIISLAVSPDGTKVATGQVGTRPCVHVWDVGSCSTVATLSGFHRRGVSCLAFSPDGTLLASVGQDDNHSLMVGRWADGGTMGTGICGRQEVLDVKFVPWSNGEELVTCGVDHVHFWQVRARNIVHFQGDFSADIAPASTMQSIGFLGNRIVTGSSCGHLYVWEEPLQEEMLQNSDLEGGTTVLSDNPPNEDHTSVDNAIETVSQQVKREFVTEMESKNSTSEEGGEYYGNEIGTDDKAEPKNEKEAGEDACTNENMAQSSDGAQCVDKLQRRCARVLCAHDGAVNAMHDCPHGLVTGGADGKVVLWGADFDRLTSISSAKVCNDAVATVCWDGSTDSVLSSTCSGQIKVTVSASSPPRRFTRTIVDAPQRGIAGLAISAAGSGNCTHFYMVHSDTMLRVWDSTSHKFLGKHKLGAQARSVAAAHTGQQLAVGLRSGVLLVLTQSDSTYIVTFRHQIAGNSITACTYSADDAVLAVGSADGNIVLLDTKSRFSRLVRPKGHETCITHLTFSTNGRFLLSTAEAQSQGMWCVHTGRRQDAAQIREIEWSSSIRELAYTCSDADADVIFMFARRRGQRQIRRIMTRYVTAISGGGLVKQVERHNALQM